jgi:rhamnogalacturonyl hydrolase YesR
MCRPGQPVFWGRGNGWAMAAPARTLQHTPASHPAAALYRDRLRQSAAALKAAQSPADGLWRASILDPDDPHCPNPETTGSGGILAGLAYGVNSGVLDRATYLPVVQKAWLGLLGCLDGDSGLLGYCQPVGGGPQPASATDSSGFCVGLFLLAAEQMMTVGITGSGSGASV